MNENMYDMMFESREIFSSSLYETYNMDYMYMELNDVIVITTYNIAHTYIQRQKKIKYIIEYLNIMFKLIRTK